MPPLKKALFWVDLEMTGLNEQIDSILEIAAVVTDMDFGILEQYHTVVFQPPEVLSKMNDWCKKTHGESGLTALIPTGMALTQAESEILTLLSRHYDPQDRVVLVGNSIGNDRRFIDRYMPKLAERLHYRMIDVSSFKEIFREKYGIKVEKKGGHRAVNDIHESITELKHYLSFVQIPPKKQR